MREPPIGTKNNLLMNNKQLTAINSITDEMHQDVANINEELVDKRPKAVLKLIDELIGKLRHLKANLKRDEI